MDIWAQAVLRGVERPESCNGMFLRESARIIRLGLERSPSWLKEKDALATSSGGRLDRSLELLLDVDGDTRYILRCDEKRYHRVSSQFLCPDAFLLNFLAVLLHPTTKGASDRVLAALGDKAGWARYLIPSKRAIFHTMAEDVLRHPVVRRVREVCRHVADKTVIGIDGQYSTLLSVLYQQKHGHRTQGSSTKSDLHVQLSVQCPGDAGSNQTRCKMV